MDPLWWPQRDELDTLGKNTVCKNVCTGNYSKIPNYHMGSYEHTHINQGFLNSVNAPVCLQTTWHLHTSYGFSPLWLQEVNFSVPHTRLTDQHNARAHDRGNSVLTWEQLAVRKISLSFWQIHFSICSILNRPQWKLRFSCSVSVFNLWLFYYSF